MAVQYDVESLITDIETLLKNNLNTKLSAIDTEKNDSIVLKQVNSSAYFWDLNSSAVNYDPAILIVESDNESEGLGPATKQVITLNVTIIVADKYTDLFIVKRMHRYRRALREVIETNFQRLRGCDNLKIQSLPVISLDDGDGAMSFKAIGINIISSIS